MRGDCRAWCGGLPRPSVCAALFAFTALARGAASLLGEDVGQTKALGQIEQGHHVLSVGAAAAVDPTKDRVTVGADAPGNLGP